MQWPNAGRGTGHPRRCGTMEIRNLPTLIQPLSPVVSLSLNGGGVFRAPATELRIAVCDLRAIVRSLRHLVLAALPIHAYWALKTKPTLVIRSLGHVSLLRQRYSLAAARAHSRALQAVAARNGE
jgi:hypothetical protein